MSLTSLPYIDAEPSVSQRDAAAALISHDIPQGVSSVPHPALPPLPSSYLTTGAAQLISRVSAHSETSAQEPSIDLSRYAALETPPSTIPGYVSALETTYANTTYLRSRAVNLDLLDQYGKNAWLISNAQSDDILRRVESELKETKERIEAVNRARKGAQEESRGEIVGLQETWKEAVGRIIETQVETERLKREIERRRQAG